MERIFLKELQFIPYLGTNDLKHGGEFLVKKIGDKRYGIWLKDEKDWEKILERYPEFKEEFPEIPDIIKEKLLILREKREKILMKLKNKRRKNKKEDN